MPYAAAGQVIGLLGGSFDPAHAGHAHITTEALKRFGLDRVWWLVSPGNPLKTRGPEPLDKRMDRAREVMQHPRVEPLRAVASRCEWPEHLSVCLMHPTAAHHLTPRCRVMLGMPPRSLTPSLPRRTR